jgi:hypothetical protein
LAFGYHCYPHPLPNVTQQILIKFMEEKCNYSPFYIIASSFFLLGFFFHVWAYDSSVDQIREEIYKIQETLKTSAKCSHAEHSTSDTEEN